MERFRELAALLQKLEAADGRPVSIEQFMARVVAAVSTDELEKMSDFFLGPTDRLFQIYAENLTEIPESS